MFEIRLQSYVTFLLIVNLLYVHTFFYCFMVTLGTWVGGSLFCFPFSFFLYTLMFLTALNFLLLSSLLSPVTQRQVHTFSTLTNFGYCTCYCSFLLLTNRIDTASMALIRWPLIELTTILGQKHHNMNTVRFELKFVYFIPMNATP